MPWLQAHIQVTEKQIPLIEELFQRLGAQALSLIDAKDQPMLEPGPGETPIWAETRVSGLFPVQTDIDRLRSAIDQLPGITSNAGLSLEILKDQDWERAWMDHFQPMRFGKRLWIRPAGKALNAEHAVIVELDPGLAFGSGTHPTTALCLNWLDSAELRDKTVVDFGCGSGILGIAALKLGAKRVIAIDHDPQALLATRENARRNRVAGQLQACSAAEAAALPVRADIVLANILANILVSLADDIGSLLRPRGTLVMSGILRDQQQRVAAAYAADLRFQPPVTQEDWVLLVGTRCPSGSPHA